MDGSSESNEWAEFSEWTSLFDAVCVRTGYVGNADLAFAMCERSDRSSQRDIETMSRNIGNWRNGVNLPSRSNFRALTEVLKISADANIKQRWLELYSIAKSQKKPDVSITGTKIESENTFIFMSNVGWKSGAILLGVFSAIVVGAFLLITWLNDDSIDVQALYEKNEIVWRRDVSMHVGEQVVVHAKRGLCGALPPPEESIRRKFPEGLEYGELAVGNLGARYSRRCGGPTPAVEIIYKATSVGIDEFVLYGDPIKVTVYPYE